LARGAIRMAFHDGGTWSHALAAEGQNFGGADGSLYLFAEWQRPENLGMEDNVNTIGELGQAHNVGIGDMIQFAAAHAVVTCHLGPRIRTFVGRTDAVQPSPMNLLPSAFATGDSLVALMQDKTFGSTDVAALVGAHSTSKQFVTNLTCVGCSQDSTPNIWDVQFYNETMTPPTPLQSETIYQFPSDLQLMEQSAVREEWLLFVENNTAAGDTQDHWNEDFSVAFIRLGLLSVMNINADMIECTDALPQGTGNEAPEANTGSDFNFHGGLDPVTNSTKVKRDSTKSEWLEYRSDENLSARKRSWKETRKAIKQKNRELRERKESLKGKKRDNL